MYCGPCEYCLSVSIARMATLRFDSGREIARPKTIETSVTSVLQTTAGKMIFGKYEERGFSRPSHAPPGVVPAPQPVPNTSQRREESPATPVSNPNAVNS